MLIEFLKTNVGENTAPFVAVALFVAVVGVSLWLTPHLAKWIDARRDKRIGFYDGMLEQQPGSDEED